MKTIRKFDGKEYILYSCHGTMLDCRNEVKELKQTGKYCIRIVSRGKHNSGANIFIKEKVKH